MVGRLFGSLLEGGGALGAVKGDYVHCPSGNHTARVNAFGGEHKLQQSCRALGFEL